MDPVDVVVILKFFELFFQIAPIPEKNLVEVFTSNRADEPVGGELLTLRRWGLGNSHFPDKSLLFWRDLVFAEHCLFLCNSTGLSARMNLSSEQMGNVG